MNYGPPVCCLLVVAGLAACRPAGAGQPAPADVVTLPPLIVHAPRPALSLGDAVNLALERNPELAAFRQQRGIAAAGVVIARQYPFNPLYEAKFASANGPPSAGVTNHVVQEQRLLFELEVRGQPGYRRQAAQADLTRTEWEVAFQEVRLVNIVVLAFQEVLYRQAKLRLADERLRLNEQTAALVLRLREQGKLSPADLILVQAEVADARAARQPALLALTKARANLRHALGVLGDVAEPAGPLEGPPPAVDAEAFLQLALERRPDLHARAAAVAEAAALVRLEVANRFGNPTLGPSYDLDPTAISIVGAQMILPVPAFNVRRGEIELRKAQQAKAALELRQTEILVREDVEAVLDRLASARNWVYTYQAQLLPRLQKSLAAIEQLFAAGEPGVDVLRVVSVRHTLLTARDVYLDALWELSQARADLILAVGDPGVLLGPAAGPPPTELPSAAP